MEQDQVLSVGGDEPGISEVGGPLPTIAFSCLQREEHPGGSQRSIRGSDLLRRSGQGQGQQGGQEGSTSPLSQTRGLTCEGHSGAKRPGAVTPLGLCVGADGLWEVGQWPGLVGGWGSLLGGGRESKGHGRREEGRGQPSHTPPGPHLLTACPHRPAPL